jgi:ferredoxin
MFDLGFTSQSNKDVQLLRSGMDAGKLKKLGNSIHPYDFDEFNQINSSGEHRNWFSSKGLGGFSTIWGATWKPFTSLSSKEWEEAHRTANEMIFESVDPASQTLKLESQIRVSSRCSCFDFLEPQEFITNFNSGTNWNIKLAESSLAVYENRCVMCGLCQQKCPTNAIWSSLGLIKSCKNIDNFKLIDHCFVERFSESNTYIELDTSVGQIQVDYLFIAAGPLATSALILKSRSDLSSIFLADTRMVTIPFLKLKSNKNHSGGFSLSGRDVDFASTDDSKFQLHLQIYAHIDLFQERIQSQFPIFLHKLIAAALGILKSRLYIGLLYVDSRLSGSLKLNWDKSLISQLVSDEVLSDHHEMLIQAVNSLKKTFQLWPIWKFAKFGGVGDSYHLGRIKGIDIGSYGEVSGSARTFAVGAAGLPIIEPGPITMTAMAHAIRSAKKLIENLPKF